MRRPGTATVLAIAPLILLLLYGVSRVAAPFGLLGALFDHPWDYALAAAAFAVASIALMAIRPVDRRVGKLLAGARARGSRRPRSRPSSGRCWPRSAGRRGSTPATSTCSCRTTTG